MSHSLLVAQGGRRGECLTTSNRLVGASFSPELFAALLLVNGGSRRTIIFEVVKSPCITSARCILASSSPIRSSIDSDEFNHNQTWIPEGIRNTESTKVNIP